jgi:TolB-like protein/class 3 adenylate cyclase
MTEQRRLAAILVADVVGYSKLMGSDEAGTLAQLEALGAEIIKPQIAKHAGRLFKSVGDGFLIEFSSAVQAVNCAKAIQEANGLGSLPLRIGIHVGDVVVQGDDLMGDGVNIAARIEGIADPGGIAITRAVHEQVRDKLDLGFMDKGKIELKNIQRPVQVFVIGGAKVDGQVTALPLPDRPSIAVLPFQNMSGDPEQEYFTDGIVEDIITALSRFKSLFVIARNSSFTYKGKDVDIKQVGRELGVRYVLEGSVRKAANRVRITGQLIDSQSGAHLWADRFDGALEDIFDVQDRVATSVVAAIVPKLDQAEIERAKRKPVESLDAYDFYLRGMASCGEGTKDGEDEALRLFYSAIERDPGFATPYGMAALRYLVRRNTGRVEDKDREEAETRRLATRVSVIGSDDAVALSSAGVALIYVCRDYETGAALIDRALAINPNIAFGHRQRGWASSFLGQHEDALKSFAHALRLSPLDPHIGEGERGMAAALTFLGRYDEASDWAKKAFAHEPNVLATMRVSAIAHAFAGNIEEARRIAVRLCQQDPALRVSKIRDYLPHRRSEDIDLFAEGLRRAGVPE